MSRWHPLPAEVYALVEDTPATVLLESAPPGVTVPPGGHSAEDHASRLFTAPHRILTAHQPSEIPSLFAEIESAVAAGLFAAGYFAYECGAAYEPSAALRPPPPGQPIAWFGIYNRCHVFDHTAGTFSTPHLPNLSQVTAAPSGDATLEAAFTLSEPEYVQRIAAIHNWIRAGDVYQLNFTAPYKVRTTGSIAALYARLRSRQPVDFGAFLHTQPGRRILSCSPELFFRIETQGGKPDAERRITTRPMKGTAPRGRTTAEDSSLAHWLRDDPKNRAENVMIVDLLRNDLGRLCNFGSVQVQDLFAVERHPTLWQMTSTVTGELRPGTTLHQVFRALFPSGSITGAPKVRAMQLIAQLEPEPRGVYTGAIGFFSPRQTVFNVAIRTLDLEGGSGRMGVGSGVVIDSDPDQEFRECALKAQFLTRPASQLPQSFSLIETMLWQGNFPLLELHLDRLQDSAAYFALPCDRAAVKAALHAHAATFADAHPRKVRLLLNPEGDLQITNELLLNPQLDPQIEPGAPSLTHPFVEKVGIPAIRVCIAPQRTDPADPLYFHKTTHRPLYTAAFKAAAEAGFEEVLFFNLRGELTEGAISNVFLKKASRWFTPPIASGVLPGVFRRHLLASRPEIEERILTLDDLRQADGVYLANAARGLRPAAVHWEAQPLPIPDPA